MKIVALLITGLFLLNSAVYGIDLPNKPHLRPPLQVNTEKGRQRLIEALSEVTYHEYVNSYIAPQAKAQYEAFLRRKSLEDNAESLSLFYDSLEKFKGIAVMEIDGLYENRRILEHLGLGRVYGRPIIYITSSLVREDREEILHHASDEITGWTKERKSLGLGESEWHLMRDCILEDYQRFETIKDGIHAQAHNIDHILEKHKAKHVLSEKEGLLYVIASMPFKKGDVMIAAGGIDLRDLEWPFEVPQISRVISGYSYFLEIHYRGGTFYIGLTDRAIKDLDKLCRLAEKRKKFEIGAFGIGRASDDYRFIVIERLILPRNIKVTEAFPDLPSHLQLEILAEGADILVEPNGVHYTDRYRRYVQQQGKIVAEIHSHFPHTKTLTTKGKWPSPSDIDSLRGDIIPAGGIIHSEGFTFYHASQHDERDISKNIVFDLPRTTSPKRRFLFGSPQAAFSLQSDGRARTRKEIANILNRSERTIQPDLYFLVKAGVLVKKARGANATYGIDPELLKNPVLIERIEEILNEEFEVLKKGWANRENIRKKLLFVIRSGELFAIVTSQDIGFQVSLADSNALERVDFNRNIPLFIAQDIFANPAGFIESWEKFGQPVINILAQNEEEREKVNRLKSVGLIPQGAEVILVKELPGRLLEGGQGVLFGFQSSIPTELPDGIQRFQFAELQEGEVLNWERPFTLLLYRLRVSVEYERLPQERPFTEAYLGSLMTGEVFDITDIPVGVKVSEDIQRSYQNFRDAVGGV